LYVSFVSRLLARFGGHRPLKRGPVLEKELVHQVQAGFPLLDPTGHPADSDASQSRHALGLRHKLFAPAAFELSRIFRPLE
jgi:hypothetical protein